MRSSARDTLGEAGETYGPLIDGITAEVIGRTYAFQDIGDYMKLPSQDKARQYWREILYRAHWAASSNLLRHARWAEACVRMYAPDPNYLAFCAALRGLTEAAADAAYSLGPVPITLADNCRKVAEALDGRATTDSVECRELEDRLIHFQFARKMARDESAPDQHKAFPLRKYLSSIEPPGELLADPLYDALCQVVHPAAQSLLWLSTGSSSEATLTSGNDKEWIDALCQEFREAIEYVQMQSVNSSVLVLQVLNFFGVPEVRTDAVERIDTSSLPARHKIDQALRSQRPADL